MQATTKRYKQRMFSEAPALCGERGRIITQSYQSSVGKPIVLRRAIAFKDILEQMTIFIGHDEQIVGNQASAPYKTPIFPEFSIDFLVDEMDTFESRPYDRFTVDQGVKHLIREIAPFWKGHTHEDRVVSTTHHILPEALKEAWEENCFRLNDVLYNSVRKSSGDGHIIPSYRRLLRYGITGVINDAKEALANLDMQHDVNGFKKKIFLDAVIMSYEAVRQWMRRYGELAEKLACETEDAEETARLNNIHDICMNLSHRAPQNFHEALQLTYFMHLLIHIESNGHSVSFGRIDQYLLHYYEQDKHAERMNAEQALDLIQHFYIKVSRLNKVRPWPETRLKSGAPMFMTLTLGGVTKTGADASNALTYLFLEALRETRLPQPTPILRVHEDTPKELLVFSADILAQHGGGLPAFFSDNANVAALMSMGIPAEEARDYGISGCSEATIPGKSLSFTGGDCYFNFLKILEIVLHEGVNPRTGWNIFPTKALEEHHGIADIIAEYQRHLAMYMSLVVPLTAVTSATDADLNPTPFTSGTIDYRIHMASDMSEGRGENARYSQTILQGHGTADFANSIYAIERLVFQDKVVTLREFVEILDNNWAGENGRIVRTKALKLPKYGNDIPDVDQYAVTISEMFAAEAARYTPWRGGVFGISLQGLTANVPEGETVGATPDGRMAQEALSDNVSPHAGTDITGPTATLKSVSVIDHTKFVNGNILNLRFHPTVLLNKFHETDEIRGAKFADLIKGYLVDLQGSQVQFNIVSADTLRKAQADPQKYRDLIVKVAGYSAYFNSLDKGLQDQIIERTEHMM